MPAGRPTKCTPETVERVCQYLRAGNTRQTAYTVAGVGRETFYRWLSSNSEFREAVEKAEEEAVARNVMVLMAAAQKSWQAAAWWLERRRPGDFKLRDEAALSGTITVRFEGGEAPGDRSAGSAPLPGGGGEEQPEVQRPGVREAVGQIDAPDDPHGG